MRAGLAQSVFWLDLHDGRPRNGGSIASRCWGKGAKFTTDILEWVEFYLQYTVNIQGVILQDRDNFDFAFARLWSSALWKRVSL